MKISDVQEVTRQAVAQTLGEEYMGELGHIENITVAQLVDMGTRITESTELQANGRLDKFVNALIPVLGKYEFFEPEVMDEYFPLYIDDFEWGGYVARVYAGIREFFEDDRWNLVNGRSYDDNVFYGTDIVEKVYDKVSAYDIPISITVDILKTAFTSWAEMDKFLSLLQSTVRETRKLKMLAIQHMLLMTAVAISNASTKTAVHLLSDYNTLNNTNLTVDQALNSNDFMLYATRIIRRTRKNMSVFTTAFNDKTMPQSATVGNDQLIVLGQFVDYLDNIKANIYNDTYLSFGGNYHEINMWQGISKAGVKEFSWDAVSSVSVSDPKHELVMTDNSGQLISEFNSSNIVALAYDRRALGFTLDKRKVTSNYVGRADFTNYYHHDLLMHICDPTFSIVSFDLN